MILIICLFGFLLIILQADELPFKIQSGMEKSFQR